MISYKFLKPYIDHLFKEVERVEYQLDKWVHGITRTVANLQTIVSDMGRNEESRLLALHVHTTSMVKCTEDLTKRVHHLEQLLNVEI